MFRAVGYRICICVSGTDQVLTLIPGWACFFYLLYSMTDDAEIKGFDPFAILGVTPSTEAREIKKQYRALSLIYHPDKVGACRSHHSGHSIAREDSAIPFVCTRRACFVVA